MAAVLNCIVDESALLAGLGDGTQDNLKAWVEAGALNLFVPLYTLERLNLMRSSPPPTNLEARKTLEWLDQVTSVTHKYSSGRVQLQEPDHQYQEWAEVERYLLPDTPLSVQADNDDRDEEVDKFNAGLNKDRLFANGNQSNEMTHAGINGDIAKHFSNGNNSHGTIVPGDRSNIVSGLRPLLNFVVWRTHHVDSTIAGSGKYILLTNDHTTQKQAQKFGVRAKLLEQVRGVVEKDIKRLSQQNTLTSPLLNGTITQNASTTNEDDEDEDEVVFGPAQRPSSSRGPNTTSVNLMDPNHFGRSPVTTNHGPRSPKPVSSLPRSPRSPHNIPTAPAAARGSEGSARGRGYRGRGRGHGPGRGSATVQYKAKPIDPDSYARPPPSMRGRGVRRLYDPSNPTSAPNGNQSPGWKSMRGK